MAEPPNRTPAPESESDPSTVSEWYRDQNRDLDTSLRRLALHIDFPPAPDLTAAVRQRIEREPPRRWLLNRLLPRRTAPPRWAMGALALLIALAVAAALALSFSPGARDAVAGRLGLRGIAIVVQTPTPARSIVPGTPETGIGRGTPSTLPVRLTSPVARPSPTPLGEPLNLGVQVALAEARAKAPFPIELPSGFGAPDEVWLLSSPNPETVVTLIYRPRPRLPETATSGVGLLLSEFEGSLDQPLLVKSPAPAQIVSLTVNGEPGFWISGQHELGYLYHAPDGMTQFDQRRLAGNALIWEHGPLTLRLESALSQSEALQLAKSTR